jgi:HK97 family phage prohead protease
VYDQYSKVIYGSFKERIQAGAFDEWLDNGNEVRALVMHNMEKICGKRSNGTCKLKSTDTELRFEVVLPNTTYANDLLIQIDRKDIAGVSIGFRGVSDQWGKEDDVSTRTVTKAELYEFSFVVDPAYNNTSVSMRGSEEFATEAEYRNLLPQIENKPETMTLDEALQNLFAMNSSW